ncbi:MAG: cyclase family protein, partial [Caldisphaera sp.]
GFFSCQGLDVEAAEFLLNKKIKMIGTDLGMVDIVGDKRRPLHMLFLKNEIPLIENLVNLEKLPKNNQFLFVGFPLNLKSATASPIRAVAILDEVRENEI